MSALAHCNRTGCEQIDPLLEQLSNGLEKEQPVPK